MSVILLASLSCGRPAVMPMEKAPARGQKLLVFPPLVEGFPEQETATVSAGLFGSVLTHLGKSGQSSQVGWNRLKDDYGDFHRQVFLAAHKAYLEKTRELKDVEFPERNTTLFRELNEIGERFSSSWKLMNLPAWTPSHLLFMGVSRFERPFLSNRHLKVYAYVVDRESRQLAFGISMELQSGGNLFRQVEALIKAGKQIASPLLSWFPADLPAAMTITVPLDEESGKTSTDPNENTESTEEE